MPVSATNCTAMRLCFMRRGWWKGQWKGSFRAERMILEMRCPRLALSGAGLCFILSHRIEMGKGADEAKFSPEGPSHQGSNSISERTVAGREHWQRVAVVMNSRLHLQCDNTLPNSVESTSKDYFAGFNCRDMCLSKCFQGTYANTPSQVMASLTEHFPPSPT